MADERGHILVVDDNRMNRLKLSIGLEQQGHTVSLAEDGQQALEMLEAGSYDVVLLDIIMPGMDGFQVLERIKGDPRLRDIPVIVISALDEIDSAVRCIEMGAEDYLPKPFNPVLLRARLSNSLQKKKLRDLEKAYLQQEVMLRQSEKLATLGRLSAGMAHELNNPAAGVQRGAAQLETTFSRLQQAWLKLSGLDLTEPQTELLRSLEELACERAARPAALDSLSRSDRESELEAWLDAHAVENAWEMAPNLVNLGYDVADLSRLAAELDPSQLLPVLEWLSCSYNIYGLLEEMGQGAGRIAGIVNALKVYTFLDQAPIQTVDVQAGLESTLAVGCGERGPGIMVQRDYAPDLPQIEAYGSELNQVWTNLINNAIDALDGAGEITLRTRYDGAWVIVEVEDTGPGIPQEIQPHLFDPFFTTKPPGKGVGLGLSICHQIVVEKHGGRIDVVSQPGRTRFEVRLPLHLATHGEPRDEVRPLRL
jgi:signal transduction histidine kinase